MAEKLIEIKDLEISFGEGHKKFVAVKNAFFDGVVYWSAMI